MKCKKCRRLIKTELESLNGIDQVKVNISEENATIKYDPKKIEIQTIKSAIKELGYDPQNKNNYSCKEKDTKNTLMQGLIYGFIPHIGCIGFVIGSILGVTVLMNLFRPFLMNRYFFHALILMSMVFVTISATIYLKRNELLTWNGIKKKKAISQ